jgi:hypothetical protein
MGRARHALVRGRVGGADALVGSWERSAGLSCCCCQRRAFVRPARRRLRPLDRLAVGVPHPPPFRSPRTARRHVAAARGAPGGQDRSLHRSRAADASLSFLRAGRVAMLALQSGGGESHAEEPYHSGDSTCHRSHPSARRPKSGRPSSHGAAGERRDEPATHRQGAQRTWRPNHGRAWSLASHAS